MNSEEIQLKFERISSWPDGLNEAVLSRALGESKTIINIHVSPAVSTGEHFLSTILRAEVEYKNKNCRDKLEKTSLILKTFPQNHLKSFIHDYGILTKECKMYTDVLPKMSDILGRHITPRYLESNETNLLILEDLRLNNFRTGDRIKGLNFDQCISAMTVLADFHGASYTMNKRHPEIIECVKKEVQYTEENVFQKKYVNNCFKIVAAELQNWPGCVKYSSRLYNVGKTIWNNCVKEILPNENEIMVLNHGDFWTNNILYRYDDKDPNRIIDVKLIDFQFCRWSTPAIDLQNFFTISVHNKDYIQTLLDTYLTRLNKHIHPKLMTRSQLLDAFHRTECIGMAAAVCVLPALLLDPSKAINLKEVDPEKFIDGVNDYPLCRISCKDDTYKKIFPEYLKYYEGVGLL